MYVYYMSFHFVWTTWTYFYDKHLHVWQRELTKLWSKLVLHKHMKNACTYVSYTKNKNEMKPYGISFKTFAYCIFHLSYFTTTVYKQNVPVWCCYCIAQYTYIHMLVRKIFKESLWTHNKLKTNQTKNCDAI